MLAMLNRFVDYFFPLGLLPQVTRYSTSQCFWKSSIHLLAVSADFAFTSMEHVKAKSVFSESLVMYSRCLMMYVYSGGKISDNSGES